MTRLRREGFAQKKTWAMDLPTQIELRLAKLGVHPGDVIERFVRGSGPGGQKINKTASTVSLHHAASGIEVRCQAGRSQAANREQAWELFCRKLEERRREARAAAKAEKERDKRRRRTRSPAQKARVLAEKRHRSGIKSNRGRVSRGE